MNNKTNKLALVFFSAALALSFPVEATIAQPELNKIINSLHNKFHDEINNDILSPKADYKGVSKLRSEILDYMQGSKLENFEDQWEKFIIQHHGSLANFDKLLEQKYLEKDFVKNKYKENLIMERYFEQEIIPKISQDLAIRDQIIQEAGAQGIRIAKQELKEKFFHLVEVYGGKRYFESFGKKYDFNTRDIFYFSKTDMLAKMIQEASFNQKFAEDSNFQTKINHQVEEYYNNRKEQQYAEPTRYYFSQIFVSKSVPNGESLAATIYDKLEEIQTTNSESLETETSNDIFNKLVTKLLAAENPELEDPSAIAIENAQIERMIAPISAKSKLYSKQTIDAVMALEAGAFSPVITSDSGFHIFKLDEKVAGRIKELAEVQTEILEQIKANYINNQIEL